MKRIKFLYIFILVAIIGVFSFINIFAIKKDEITDKIITERLNDVNNCGKYGDYRYIVGVEDVDPFNSQKNVITKILQDTKGDLYFELDGIKKRFHTMSDRFFNYLPILKDIGEFERIKYNKDLKIESFQDPQYIIKKEKYKEDDENRIWYICDGVKKFYKLEGDEIYRDLEGTKYEQLPVFDKDYVVVKQDGKIYYEVDGSPVYEVVDCGNDKISYQINGDEKFFSLKGKKGYFMSLTNQKNHNKSFKDQYNDFLNYYIGKKVKRLRNNIER